MSYNLLLLSNNPVIVELLESFIDHDTRLLRASSLLLAEEYLRSSPISVVIAEADYHRDMMPAFLLKTRVFFPNTGILYICDEQQTNLGKKAVLNGATLYVTIDHAPRLLPVLLKTMLSRSIYRGALLSNGDAFQFIVGNSERLYSAINKARELSSNAAVVIAGERGTGKCLFARAMHQTSKNEIFHPLACDNCSNELINLTLRSLLEERGANEPSRTLYITRVDILGQANLDLLVQLIQKWSHPSSACGEISFSKIILGIEKHTGLGSELPGILSELFPRLAETRIELPSLREMKDDIELFIQLFLSECRVEHNKVNINFSKEALEMLKQYPWKGNVAELKMLIKGLVISFPRNDTISAAMLPIHIQTAARQLIEEMHKKEKEQMLKVLAYTGGDKYAAARLLGIGVKTLERKLIRYRI